RRRQRLAAAREVLPARVLAIGGDQQIDPRRGGRVGVGDRVERPDAARQRDRAAKGERQRCEFPDRRVPFPAGHLPSSGPAEGRAPPLRPNLTSPRSLPWPAARPSRPPPTPPRVRRASPAAPPRPNRPGPARARSPRRSRLRNPPPRPGPPPPRRPAPPTP